MNNTKNGTVNENNELSYEKMLEYVKTDRDQFKAVAGHFESLYHRRDKENAVLKLKLARCEKTKIISGIISFLLGFGTAFFTLINIL